jgi:two-component system, CitB family, sensor kinase
VKIALAEGSQLGEQPPHLRGLLTIVGNLLDNAVDAAVAADAGPGEARVSLAFHETPSAVTVQVADSGSGVRPEDAESIFEDGWSTRPDRGTARRGLGLALVKRLVQQHRGTVSVSSCPGAVFTVTLPLSDADPASARWTAEENPFELAPLGGDRW